MIPMMIISGMWEETGKRFLIKVRNEEKTLFQILTEHDIYIDAPCGGAGSCGRCRVRFLKGAPAPGKEELAILDEKERKAGWRLSCRTVPRQDCSLFIPAQVQPSITAEAGYHDDSPCNLKRDSGLTADSGYPVLGERTKEPDSYGIAVDLGTTTIAAAFVELPGGVQKAACTSVNPQRAFGADVISRIHAANSGSGPALQECVRFDLTQLFEELARQAGIGLDRVSKIAIAGNTVMLHLLAGFSCRGLGEFPFTPVSLSLLTRPYGELFSADGGGVPDQAEVTLLPGMSSFAGADITAGIYCSGMVQRKEPSLFLDLGTNAEMAIGGRDGILVTSAAAGPALEGGNISCGIPGIPGAVTHITLHGPDDCNAYCAAFQTIGGAEPAGLCGTGMIDIMYELVQKGIADENGTLAEPWFTGNFPIAGSSLSITQKDIREIQMAKAAVRAGIETLTVEYGDDGMRPEVIYLAGGLGFSMDVGKAVAIGMFPPYFEGRVKALGNSSLEGARRFLAESGAKDSMEWIAAHAKEMNLALYPGFHELYLQHMSF